jgi:hypothetical protein
MNQAEKLQNLLDHLTDLLFRTWSAFLVAKNLDPIIDSNDLIQERYFLVSAYVSCVESALLGFSKLTSSKKDEVSVGYLLDMCDKEASAFTRVNQANVLSVVQEHQQRLVKLEPLVQQVKMWRDKAIAHLDRKHINDPSAIAKMQPVDMEEVGEGFILLQDIINVYREWLGVGLLRLKVAESKMADEWEYLAGLIRRSSEQN